MRILDYFFLIFVDIKRRKFSSILNLLAIFFGIYSIFLIYVFGDSFQKSVEEEFLEFGVNRIYLTVEDSSKTYEDDLLNLIKKNKNVKSAYPVSSQRGFVFSKNENDGETRPIIGMEFSKEAFDSFGVEVEFGRIPNEKDTNKIVIGSLVSENFFDSKVKVGSKININNYSLKVVGILKEIGSEEDDTQMYISLDTFKEIFDKEGYSNIFITTNEFVEVETSKKSIELDLSRKYGDDYKTLFSLLTFKQILDSSKVILNMINIVFLGLGIVTLLVGFLGVMNIMFSFVDEKIKDIGIMKSIGATNSNIIILFILFSGFYGILGSILGVSFGLLTLYLIKDIGRVIGLSFFEIVVNKFYIIFMLLFGFVVGCLSGYLPARKASKLKIIDSIRK